VQLKTKIIYRYLMSFMAHPNRGPWLDKENVSFKSFYSLPYFCYEWYSLEIHKLR